MLTQETKIPPVVAAVVITGTVALFMTAAWDMTPETSRTVNNIRRGLFALIALTALLPWASSLIARLRSRERADASGTATATPSGIRRVDAYVIAGLIVAALLVLAQSNRYSVTHYREGRTVVYQRTDRFTGHAELFVIGGQVKQSPPAWVSLTAANE